MICKTTQPWPHLLILRTGLDSYSYATMILNCLQALTWSVFQQPSFETTRVRTQECLLQSSIMFQKDNTSYRTLVSVLNLTIVSITLTRINSQGNNLIVLLPVRKRFLDNIVKTMFCSGILAAFFCTTCCKFWVFVWFYS